MSQRARERSDSARTPLQEFTTDCAVCGCEIELEPFGLDERIECPDCGVVIASPLVSVSEPLPANGSIKSIARSVAGAFTRLVREATGLIRRLYGELSVEVVIICVVLVGFLAFFGILLAASAYNFAR